MAVADLAGVATVGAAFTAADSGEAEAAVFVAVDLAEERLPGVALCHTTPAFEVRRAATSPRVTLAADRWAGRARPSPVVDATEPIRSLAGTGLPATAPVAA